MLTLTGLPLVWQYHPSRRLMLQELHVAAGLVFLVAALVLAATTAWSRFRGEATTVGWLAGAGALLLALLAGGMGQALAWSALALNRVATGADFQGLSVGLDPDVRLIYADDMRLTPERYTTFAALHMVGIPLLIVAVLVRSARQRRSSGQTDTVA